MTPTTPIAPHLQRLMRVAFQDLELYSPIGRSEADRERAAKKLAGLEALVIDRLVALLPRDAPVEHAAVADLLGGTRHEYLRLLRERVDARWLDGPFAGVAWGCGVTNAGKVDDRSWEEHQASVVLERLADGPPAPPSGSHVYLEDEELAALAAERLVLHFGPR